MSAIFPSFYWFLLVRSYPLFAARKNARANKRIIVLGSVSDIKEPFLRKMQTKQFQSV
jgi:hypothetical protein